MTKKSVFILISSTILIALLSFALISWFLLTSLFAHLMRGDTPIGESIPWGVWESYDPPMILYINDHYQIRGYFPGAYLFDDAEEKILVSFGSEGGMIGRWPHFMYIRNINSSSGIGTLPSQSDPDGFRIVDGYLHFTAGTTEIIFHRLENYNSINLNDWLPALE